MEFGADGELGARTFVAVADAAAESATESLGERGEGEQEYRCRYH
jgi:hypothetical protein